MIISIIVAVSKNNVIGNKNKMPWHFKEDMNFFKRTTLNKCIIMGRKTFFSIGKSLKNRLNVVISSKFDTLKGCKVYKSFKDALINLNKIGINSVFVIGGEQLYSEAIEYANFLYITKINNYYNGDKKFPYYDINDWEIISSDIVLSNQIELNFFILKRLKSPKLIIES